MNSERPKKNLDAFHLYMQNLKAESVEQEENLSTEDIMKIAQKKWQMIEENEKKKFYQL